jgi:hypothetical protein
MTSYQPPLPGPEPATDEETLFEGEDPGADIHPEDPDDEWRSGPVRHGFRFALPTAVLVVLVALAAGFWGGAMAEKHHNPSASSQLAGLANRLASARGSGTGAAAGGVARGGGAAATGIITAVQGQTLYLTGSDGSLIKVTLGPSATVEQMEPSTLAGLHTGNTAIVQGTRNPDGSVTATAIVSTPANASGTTGAGGAASGRSPGG